MHKGTLFLVLACVGLLAGCQVHVLAGGDGSSAESSSSSGGQQTTQQRTDQNGGSTVVVVEPGGNEIGAQQPQTSTGVASVQATCRPGAPEACNGLDDNCDGRIDEGCGYASGTIQVTMAWNGGGDMDLYVTDPMGEVLSYSNKQVTSGGVLDHDARGMCRPDQPNNTIENVFWNSEQPMRGTYRVELHYWGDCNSDAGAMDTTTSIAVGGKVIGAYSYTLTPTQRVTLATFEIP